MKQKFWNTVHNVIAHPLLVLGFDWTERFHDWTAQRAYPSIATLYKTPQTISAVVIDGIPRRDRLDLNTPAELSISNAINEVEKIGAHANLTVAISLLSKAKDLVSDYIDYSTNTNNVIGKDVVENCG